MLRKRQAVANRPPAGSPRRVARRALVASAAAVVVGTGVAACSSSQGTSSSGSADANYVSSTQPIVTYPVAKRRPAPTLAGTTLDGAKLSTASLRGKVVVVNVWGSWCTECRLEGPFLQQAYEQTKAKGVEFVGIDTRDSTAGAKASDAKDHITYPSLQDPSEALVLKFKSIVPSTTVPSTVIIDRQGRVAVRAVTTFGSTSQLLSVLDPIIAEH